MSVQRDRRLLAMLREGEIEGIVALYDRHGHRCLTLAGELVGGAPAAHEVVFEVFLRLWRQFVPRQIPLRTWLLEETRQLARLHSAGVARFGMS
jgi:DNA-directed RNA polymerase specialized sigma24 family protein